METTVICFIPVPCLLYADYCISLCVYRCVGRNCTALVELEVCRPICVETYQDCKGLGRFMLRYCGNTIATGIVTKVSCTDKPFS